MKDGERIIARIGLFLILLTVLFPPWNRVGAGVVGQKVIPYSSSAGRHFLFGGPPLQPRGINGGTGWAEINAGELMAEIAIIACVTTFVLTFRQQERNDARRSSSM